MRETPLKYSEIEAKLNSEARDAICHVIIAWGMLDTMISQLLLRAFGLTMDDGSILLGTMDTRTKLDRLKMLYNQHGMPEAAQSIATLSALHSKHVTVRNAIAHSVCAGHFRRDPRVILFTSGKFMRGAKGLVSGTGISVASIANAAKFASEVSGAINETLGKHRMPRSKSPLTPPLFALHPHRVPQKRRDGKRSKPPQSPQE